MVPLSPTATKRSPPHTTDWSHSEVAVSLALVQSSPSLLYTILPPDPTATNRSPFEVTPLKVRIVVLSAAIVQRSPSALCMTVPRVPTATNFPAPHATSCRYWPVCPSGDVKPPPCRISLHSRPASTAGPGVEGDVGPPSQPARINPAASAAKTATLGPLRFVMVQLLSVGLSPGVPETTGRHPATAQDPWTHRHLLPVPGLRAKNQIRLHATLAWNCRSPFRTNRGAVNDSW